MSKLEGFHACTHLHSLSLLIALVLFLFPVPDLDAQSQSTSDAGSASILITETFPFSLDTVSAIDCIDLLRETRFLLQRDDDGKAAVLTVETVWSSFLSYDQRYPEGHRLRYDIIVNGSPLDWDRSFIEYGGEMINMRLLYLYRNQHPEQALEYRITP